MKKQIKDYSLIIVGASFIAAGLQLFLVPFKYSSGGIGTLSTVIFYTSHIQMSVSYLIIDAFIFLFGWKHLCKNTIIKSIVGSAVLSLFLEICTYIEINPQDKIVSFIMGGILDGIGMGLVIRAEASTGGVDLAALIIKKFFSHFSVASIIFVINAFLIALSGIVFKSFEVTFYSIAAMFVSEKITEVIINVGIKAKSVMVISDRYEEIEKIIQNKYERGVTEIYARGAYEMQDKMSLICVATPKEVSKMVKDIMNQDKSAFVVVSDVKEVRGNGFIM